MPDETLEDYAIVIGINSYASDDNEGFASLTSAVSDATKFIEWLRSPTGGNIGQNPDGISRIVPIFSPPVSPGNLPKSGTATPVKDDIDNALKQFGVAGQGPIGRRLYFYFSGHGIGVSSQDIAMLMANAVRSMESRNVGLRNYRLHLQERKLFEEVVFIADCCRTRDTRPIDLGKPPFVTNQAPNLPGMKDIAILAAEYGDPSFAVTNGHGLLTQALLDALNGDTEAVDQLGRVTTNSLKQYLPKKVGSLATQNLVRQKPEVDCFPSDSDIILAKIDRKVDVKMIAEDSINGEIQILDGENNILHTKDANSARASSPWIVKLTDTKVPYRIKVLSPPGKTLLLELDEVKNQNNEFHVS